MKKNNLEEFEGKIDYKFKNIGLLKIALTHSSFAHEKKLKVKYNERLEFLGDSILSLVVSEYVFRKCPSASEGKLTKIRANTVCEKSLFMASKKLEAGDFIYLGKGEEFTDGRNRTSLLADVFEAIIGAIYIDGGIVEAEKFILLNLRETIESVIEGGDILTDYKTQLQEIIQRDVGTKIEYVLIKEEGPAHNKIFHTDIYINDERIEVGVGKSKKESEQDSAKKALSRMCKIEEK